MHLALGSCRPRTVPTPRTTAGVHAAATDGRPEDAGSPRSNEQGRPWIDDTNVKVIEVVLDHLAHGWKVEAIQENHPGLSLAQVYAALAWCYAHQAEMDAGIELQRRRLEALRAHAVPSPLERRLAAHRRGA